LNARQQFYATVSAAVNDFVEHGFDSQARLERWLTEIRRAAVAALMPEHEMLEFLRQSLGRTFRAATSDVVLRRKHRGLTPFTLERIRPALRPELDRRVLVSANLIRLNKAASVERTLQRFSGWASSIPSGGSDIAERRETAERVRRSIAGLPFEERRVIVDQGHKLAAAVNDIVARDGGAIAMVWHHVNERPPAYAARPSHVVRNGKIFLIRDSWALKSGLIKPAGREYLDQVTQPGEEPFCRCSGVYLYTPADLPPEMWTDKGRAMVLRVTYGESNQVRGQDGAAAVR
jgi:hypothetical protein